VESEGRAFDAAIKDTPERKAAVMDGVVDMLKSSGIDLRAFYTAANQPGDLGRLLASQQVQNLLYTAAAAMLDGKAHGKAAADLKAKLIAADLPPVTRPGSRSGNAVSSAPLPRLAASYGSDSKGLAAAAALLAARRNSR